MAKKKRVLTTSGYATLPVRRNTSKMLMLSEKASADLAGITALFQLKVISAAREMAIVKGRSEIRSDDLRLAAKAILGM